MTHVLPFVTKPTTNRSGSDLGHECSRSAGPASELRGHQRQKGANTVHHYEHNSPDTRGLATSYVIIDSVARKCACDRLIAEKGPHERVHRFTAL